jgi:hypothetical protein
VTPLCATVRYREKLELPLLAGQRGSQFDPKRSVGWSLGDFSTYVVGEEYAGPLAQGEKDVGTRILFSWVRTSGWTFAA